MKYSFMTFSTPELGLADVLALAKRLGYDGVEPRLDAGHAHGVEVALAPAERDRVRKAFLDSGIAAACLATSCTFADPDSNQEMVRQAHERIDLAGDVGAPCLRVFGGHFPETVSRQQAVDNLVDCLGSLGDHAGERGVTVCLETHDAWCDPSHVSEVLQRVDHPAVGVNWDIMHPVRGGLATIDESFVTLKPWIGHLHVHDGTTRDGKMQMVPIGTGDIDHGRAIALLKTIDFAGHISGEWIKWEPYETHLPRELAALKALERQLA